jgi:hypothetical protein
MRDLYRGLISLAVDATFRDQVTDVADIRFDAKVPMCTPFPDLRRQPNLDALRTMNTLFRAKKLFLGTYALAEINRWIVDGGVRFHKALDKLGKELTPILPADPTSGVHEAAGALVIDPRLMQEFRVGRDLTKDGFDLTATQQNDLRDKFKTDSEASKAAEAIFRFGWPTGTCEGAFLVYDAMFHSNV